MSAKKSKKDKIKFETDANHHDDMTVLVKKSKKKAVVDESDNVTNSNDKQSKKRKKSVENNNTEMDVLNGELVKKKKKDKKAKKRDESPAENNNDRENGVVHVEKDIKKEQLYENEDLDTEEDNKSEADKKKEEPMWSNDDLMQLVEKMEKVIPDQDSMAFSTRAEKLPWEKIAFKDYSIEECKRTWNLLSKKIRKYRLLNEVLSDARQLILHPPSTTTRGKTKAHPDMPKRPLSSYMLFYLKKKDEYMAEHPGIELTEISKGLALIFKNLPPETKAEYEQLAAKGREEYDIKLKEFYRTHPEFEQKVNQQKLAKQRVPKKPPAPFGLYLQSEMEKEKVTEAEKTQFKEVCKERWKSLSDKKKMHWISLAEAQQIVYQNELKNYKESHPDYEGTHGLVLTKQEKQIKERIAGKPTKPPNSAYSLFVREILQSENAKQLPAKERLNFVSVQWKTCTEEDKQRYKDEHTQMMERYKLDYDEYLKSLPEDQRDKELQKTTPKRRKIEEHSEAPKRKKRKSEELTASPGEMSKFQEPVQPPITAFKYFAQNYTGPLNPTQAWKKLSSAEKEKYEEELLKAKHGYIAAFEKFLKSLTKEQLEVFSRTRNEAKQREAAMIKEEEEAEDDSSEDESSDSESDSEDDDDDDDDDDDGEEND